MSFDLLTLDINACTDVSFKGFKPIGWWTLLSNIDPASIVQTDGKVDFTLKSGQFYEILDESVNPFSQTVPTINVTGTHGYKQFSDVVKFPLKEFSPSAAAIVKELSIGVPIVIMLEQWIDGEARFPVYGLYTGLHASPEMTFTLSDDRVWEIQLEGFNTGYPQLFFFDTDVATTATEQVKLVEYEYVTATIASGVVTPKSVDVLADAGTVFYAIMPDGTVYTSVTNEISESYTGIAGTVMLLKPKGTVVWTVTGDLT